MSVQGSCDALQAGWTALRGEWDNVRETWRDAVAERFREEFWSELEDTIPEVIEEMENLAAALRRARHA